ncbi:MAG: carotenoid oxygenase family protein [Acidimicrobiales bacterium]
MTRTTSQYLSGNFAPVTDELTVFDLDVTGKIPTEMEGRFLRIGPNAVVAPDPDRYHWFLGEGMVHGVRLRESRAEWYRNRFVRTDTVVAARGGPLVPGPRSSLGGAVNTSIVGHAGRTFAAVEAGDLPVEISYELDTVTRSDFDGTLHGSFSAHPLRDPNTGELHAISYSWEWDHVRYLVVGTDGRARKIVKIPLPDGPMIHGLAMTDAQVVLLDLPVTFNIDAATAAEPFPYRWNPDHPARVGLLPKDGEADDVAWCEVEPCYVFHPLNAYDDANRVVLDVVRHATTFDRDRHGPFESVPTLDRWILDPAAGTVAEARLDDRGQEFPRHDERRLGRPYRFGYATTVDEGIEDGPTLKHDLVKGSTEVHHYGPGRSSLEPVFVPRDPGAAEDDGWVLSYVYDAGTDRSDVVILSAQDFTGEPVATIHLPRRVPFGFHGSWVPDDLVSSSNRGATS